MLLCHQTMSIWQDNFNIVEPNLAVIFALYLSRVTESVHVVEDGNELPLIGRVNDVAINFEVLDHHIHQESAQVQS